LEAAPPHLRVSIILLSQTGGRTYSEGLSLRWDQVDLDNKLIRLGNDVKTPGSCEPVPLSEFACDVLRAWNREQAAKSPFVFPSPHRPNQPISTVKTAWKATLRRAGRTALSHLQPAARLLHSLEWCRAGRRCAASDAAHESGNQAALPVGNDGSGAASNGEIQQESVRPWKITAFLLQWAGCEEGRRNSRL
jgi:integrase